MRRFLFGASGAERLCALGASLACSSGPSTSPLGVMAVGYNWTCTACGAANAAGADICRQCGSNAITSALEMETGANTQRRPPLGAAERALILVAGISAVTGVALFRIFDPPELTWWVGLGLLAACVVLLVPLPFCAAYLLWGVSYAAEEKHAL